MLHRRQGSVTSASHGISDHAMDPHVAVQRRLQGPHRTKMNSHVLLPLLLPGTSCANAPPSKG